MENLNHINSGNKHLQSELTKQTTNKISLFILTAAFSGSASLVLSQGQNHQRSIKSAETRGDATYPGGFSKTENTDSQQPA